MVEPKPIDEGKVDCSGSEERSGSSGRSFERISEANGPIRILSLDERRRNFRLIGNREG